MLPAPVATLDPLQGKELAAWWASPLTGETSETILDAVVKISQGNSGGTGVMIGRNKTGFVAILSAAHIYHARTDAKIKLQDGSTYDAWVYDYDRETDVAILGADIPPDKNIVTVPVAAEQPEPGVEVIKIGFPSYAGGQPNVRRGPVVKTFSRFLFNASVPVRLGDSGGGVFCEGQLVSIVSGFTNGDTMWGTGTTAMQNMLKKHGWACRIFPRIFPILPIRRGEPIGHPPPAPQPPKGPPKPLPPPDQIPEPISPPKTPPATGIPGPPGPSGKDGRDGKDGATPDLAPLLAAIDKLNARIDKLQVSAAIDYNLLAAEVVRRLPPSPAYFELVPLRK